MIFIIVGSVFPIMAIIWFLFESIYTKGHKMVFIYNFGLENIKIC